MIERWCAMHLPGTFTTAKTSGKLIINVVTLNSLVTYKLKMHQRYIVISVHDMYSSSTFHTVLGLIQHREFKNTQRCSGVQDLQL